jgi:hypothetical protein
MLAVSQLVDSVVASHLRACRDGVQTCVQLCVERIGNEALSRRNAQAMDCPLKPLVRLSSKYDIREIDEELYLEVLNERRALSAS